MKCLLITSYFPPTIGGSATVYGNIFKHGNPHISVLAPNTDRENGRPIMRNDAPDIYQIKYIQPPQKHCHNLLHSLWIMLTHDMPTHVRVLLKTLALIYKKKIDVICLGEIQALGWLGTSLKAITSTKIIYYAHGEELTTHSTSRFLGRTTHKHLSYSDGIVCVSSHTKSVLLNQYGVPHNKIKLITNGIDLSHFNNGENTKIRIPSSQAISLFSAGRLIDRKGFDFAILAIRKLVDKGYNVTLDIAGDGPRLAQYQALIKQYGVESYVKLIGRISHRELIKHYQQCDIFLMPNRQLENGDAEGFGLVFLEANLFYKPVIGGKSGGAIDAIRHEKTGLLVDGTSAEAITEAIIRLSTDKDLYRKLSSEAHIWALQNDVRTKVREFVEYCEAVTQQS